MFGAAREITLTLGASGYGRNILDGGEFVPLSSYPKYDLSQRNWPKCGRARSFSLSANCCKHIAGLVGVTPSPPKPAPTLGHLIVLWNRLEELLKAKLEKSGIDWGHAYFWEEAMEKGELSSEDVISLAEQRAGSQST